MVNDPSSPAKPSSVSLHLVAQHQPVHGQLVGDGQHRRLDPRVVGRQEPHQRSQQQRRVQGLGVVVLGQHAPLVDPVGEDVLLDLLGGQLPLVRLVDLAADPGQLGPSVDSDPAHDLGRGEVLQRAPDLPDPGVRLAPVLQRLVHLLVQDRPDPAVQVVGGLGVQVDRVQQRTPDVVLLLRVRGVADPDRPGVGVPRQVVELVLGQVPLAGDAVHDLQLVVPVGDVGDEGEEVQRLPVEADRVEPPERERGVPDPGEPVVVVAPSARRLRQRRGAGRGDRPGRRVGQPLQGEGAALQVGPPRVVREAARGPTSAASGGRSRPAGSRRRRTSSAAPCCPRTTPRSGCRPP